MKAIYADTLTTITRYLSTNDYAPTVTELARTLGISHNAARKRVLWLVEVGLLTYTPRRMRGIAVTGATVYRDCKCGRPITDVNRVIDKIRDGRTAYRKSCAVCFYREHKRSCQQWRIVNPTYFKRRWVNTKRQLFQERLAA